MVFEESKSPHPVKEIHPFLQQAVSPLGERLAVSDALAQGVTTDLSFKAAADLEAS